jgi:hypothetical protein
MNIVKWLKEHKSSNSIIDNNRDRPSDLARRFHHKDVADYLSDEGSIINELIFKMDKSSVNKQAYSPSLNSLIDNEDNLIKQDSTNIPNNTTINNKDDSDDSISKLLKTKKQRKLSTTSTSS